MTVFLQNSRNGLTTIPILNRKLKKKLKKNKKEEEDVRIGKFEFTDAGRGSLGMTLD